MEQYRILGILIKDRIKEAGHTQEVLSKHAGIIKSRLGFHEVSENTCSRIGFMILQLTGTPDQWNQLEEDLGKLYGIQVRQMTFDF